MKVNFYKFAICVVTSTCAANCLPAGASCDPADVTCNPLAFQLYNAPCHAREWSTFYGATTNVTFAESLVQAPDGGYAVAGKSFDPFGSPLLPFRGAAGDRNLFAAKFDEDGALLWHTFLGESGDKPVRMVGVGDGYLVTGTETVGSFGAPLVAFSGGTDGIIAKLDLNGNLLWHRYVGTGGAEQLTAAVVDAAGNYLVVGQSVGVIPNAGVVVVNHTNPGNEQMFAMWIDPNGNSLRQSHYGGSGEELALQVLPVSGGFLIGGAAEQGFDASFTNVRNSFAGAPGSNDFVIVAIDANGGYLWHTFQGAPGEDDSMSQLSALPNGRILVGGVSKQTWGAPVSPHPAPGVEVNMALFALSADGQLLWNSFFGPPGAAGSTLMSVFPGTDAANQEATVVGFTSASFGTPDRAFLGGIDFVLLAVDVNTGAYKRSAFYGGPATAEQSQPPAAARSCDNGVLISGASNGNFGTPLVPFSGAANQGLLIKLGPGEGY